MAISEKQKQAYAEVKRALADGDLPPVQDCRCTHCNGQAEHYHHPEYDEPLNVVPLCAPCHMREHRRLRAWRFGLIDEDEELRLISVNLFDQQAERLDIMTNVSGMSKSQLIRQLIDHSFCQPAIITLATDVIGDAIRERHGLSQ